jgi:hypothetical protein
LYGAAQHSAAHEARVASSVRAARAGLAPQMRTQTQRQRQQLQLADAVAVAQCAQLAQILATEEQQTAGRCAACAADLLDDLLDAAATRTARR